ncbi:hypothetical protein CC1G_12328 [Coprinopsis cinerea okayama7|uniref:Uncharacterized protein n=1 Tax=Coprinopsis cinerea (strain Okayama-7 / 130 / ATCC MYA-4618 / FGSC 9003) TaxID=240176 RepID=A8NS82_COPC7|nr:hypothetical protein CC1G_12328 [Coprinopsis cinerea okayama7\|eukprot:XP_001835958.1 hypothetical protein CC1G_12328 [Coprinopsis cinerea okayama7\
MAVTMLGKKACDSGSPVEFTRIYGERFHFLLGNIAQVTLGNQNRDVTGGLAPICRRLPPPLNVAGIVESGMHCTKSIGLTLLSTRLHSLSYAVEAGFPLALVTGNQLPIPPRLHFAFLVEVTRWRFPEIFETRLVDAPVGLPVGRSAKWYLGNTGPAGMYEPSNSSSRKGSMTRGEGARGCAPNCWEAKRTTSPRLPASAFQTTVASTSLYLSDPGRLVHSKECRIAFPASAQGVRAASMLGDSHSTSPTSYHLGTRLDH